MSPPRGLFADFQLGLLLSANSNGNTAKLLQRAEHDMLADVKGPKH